MSMNTLILLLTMTSTLVLRSGDRIAVEGPVREENGVVTFRMNGLLYSVPASEIDGVIASEEAGSGDARTARAARSLDPARDDRRPLRVSAAERDRLLRELERNHSGTPAPSTQTVPPLPPPPTRAEAMEVQRDEWEWRRMARAHEETVLRAAEELQLLENRIEELKSQIRGFTSLGFKPSQFTYQTSQLVFATEALAGARLEVARAERALVQFREDARRQGILPGWLR
jgi:hypothetical protein